jgi:hypothetical protein
MTDLVGRTLYRLGERLPGQVSMLGEDGCAATHPASVARFANPWRVVAGAVALWLLVYLVVAVAEAHQDARAGRVAAVTFIHNRPAAYSPIARDTSARTFPRCSATADN